MPAPDQAGPARHEDTGPGPAAGASPGQPPVLAIVRGDPSAGQVAALVAVLAARTAPAADAASSHGAVRSEWSSRSRMLRAPLLKGPGGWRASARPG